jgi:HAD superfamily phosphatase (TIGR01668 family)
MFSFEKLTDIGAPFLRGIGVTFLMLDLDNTIAPYGVDIPGGDVARWAASMRAGGVRLHIVSNSRKRGRAERFAEALGIGYINKARKPSTGGIMEAIAGVGGAPERSALVGDQIYTDTLAANRAGVTSILVRPIRLSNIFIAARYGLEAPFRALAKPMAEQPPIIRR